MGLFGGLATGAAADLGVQGGLAAVKGARSGVKAGDVQAAINAAKVATTTGRPTTPFEMLPPAPMRDFARKVLSTGESRIFNDLLWTGIGICGSTENSADKDHDDYDDDGFPDSAFITRFLLRRDALLLLRGISWTSGRHSWVLRGEPDPTGGSGPRSLHQARGIPARRLVTVRSIAVVLSSATRDDPYPGLARLAEETPSRRSPVASMAQVDDSGIAAVCMLSLNSGHRARQRAPRRGEVGCLDHREQTASREWRPGWCRRSCYLDPPSACPRW